MNLTKDQNDIRFNNRRRIAKQSFVMLSMTILLLLSLGLFSDDMAQRVKMMEWLVTTATGLWGVLVLGYYAAASYEQTRASESGKSGPGS